MCFGDLDRNWHTDLLLNVGGFALTDTLLGNMWATRSDGGTAYVCDTAGPGVKVATPPTTHSPTTRSPTTHTPSACGRVVMWAQPA